MPIKLVINEEIVFVNDYIIQTISNKTTLILNSLPITIEQDCSYIDLTQLVFKQCSPTIYEVIDKEREEILPQTYIDDVVSLMLNKKQELDNLCDTIRSHSLYS